MVDSVVDFFFLPYPTPQERRMQAAIDEGLAHGNRLTPHDPFPGRPVTLLFSTNASLPVEHVAVYYTLDGTEPVGEKGKILNGMLVMAQQEEMVQETEKHIAVYHWRAILPAQPENTLVRYRADGWNEHGDYWLADNIEPVSVPPLHGRVFAYHVDRWTAPQWWHDAVVYHIVVDRFNAASDEPRLLEHDQNDITGFFGGTLRGIIEKLDYIQALGANCIWLSPLFESPTAHGYNASDYYTVAKRYGTNEILRLLTSEAHRRGIRVMFDFVANHTSHEHAAFLDALAHTTSPTAEWYAFDTKFPTTYHSYAGGTDMPELRTDHPDVQRHLFDAATYWLQNLGADGLRLDYVPGPSHTFWTLFQQHIKTHFPDAVTLGEISGSLNEITAYAGRIDAFMDFPLAELLRKTFAQRQVSMTALLTYLDKRQLPQGMSSATLLDNHDMHRFLWLADGKLERLKIAAFCHMTLEGTPIVYYGTEVGLSQHSDAYKENAHARSPMFWDERQNSSVLALYRGLIALRTTHPVLCHGKRKTLAFEVYTSNDDRVTQNEQIGGYMRLLGQSYVFVLLNNSEQAVIVRFPLTKILKQAEVEQSPDTLQVLFSINKGQAGYTIKVVDAKVEIMLAAFDAVVIGV